MSSQPPSISLPKSSSLMPKSIQDPFAQRIMALSALVFALGGTGALSYGVASKDTPTSQETASLQEELRKTQDQLSETELGKKMDEIVVRLERLEQNGKDNNSAVDLRQDKQLRFIAELTALHNKGSPAPDYPVPSEFDWYASIDGAEPYRSKRGHFPDFE